MASQTSYLLVIGEREALAWILREGRMAFPGTRRPEVDRLAVDDELLPLTTRGCFHNPGRDRTRVVGRAVVTTPVVTTPVVTLDPPVELAGRTFPRGCDLDITKLTPYLQGVELTDLVPKLDAFPDKANWSIRLRRPLVPLSARDADILRERLETLAHEPPDSARQEYLDKIRPVARVDR